MPKMQPFQADPSVGLGEGAIDISPKLDAAWNVVAAVSPGLWRAKSMHDWIEGAALFVRVVATAWKLAGLAPFFSQVDKRWCFHPEFLPAFNQNHQKESRVNF